MEYLEKSWGGHPQEGGRSLAKALAVLIAEFVLEYVLKVAGKVLKRIKAAIRSSRRVSSVGRRVRRATRAVGRVTSRVRSGARKVQGVIVRNGKIVLDRLSPAYLRAVNTIGDLRQRVLSQFGFKRVWAERSGRYIEVWGEFNPKVLLMRQRTNSDGEVVYSHELVDDGGIAGKTGRTRTPTDQSVIGGRPPRSRTQVIVSDDYLVYLDELQGTNPAKYQEAVEELHQALSSGKSKQEIAALVRARASEGTSVLRRGIPGPKPKNFQAHHAIPRETKQLHGDFFDEIGFDLEDGAINGIMVPPNDAVRMTAPNPNIWADFAHHMGSHPDYTLRINRKIAEIRGRHRRNLIDNKEALAEMNQLALDAKAAISSANSSRGSVPKTVNDVRF